MILKRPVLISIKTIRVIPLLFTAGLLLIVAIVDHWLLPKFSLELFYIFPIILFVSEGKWYGLFFSFVAAFLAKTITQNEEGFWELGITGGYWNLFTLIGFYLTVALLAFIVNLFYDQMTALSQQDTQTGLLNQKAFLAVLSTEQNRSERLAKVLSVVYLDLDNFKAINDSCGHAFGDVIIQFVGDVLKTLLRDYDDSARMGGDEFALLLPETNSINAQQIVQRLQTIFSEIQMSEFDNEIKEKMSSFPATFSVGIVTYHTPKLSAEEILQAADQQMYEAKKKGKNKICAKQILSSNKKHK